MEITRVEFMDRSNWRHFCHGHPHEGVLRNRFQEWIRLDLASLPGLLNTDAGCSIYLSLNLLVKYRALMYCWSLAHSIVQCSQFS